MIEQILQERADFISKGMKHMQQMSEQAIAARREYQRKWRKANPEKVREKNRRYWEKQAKKREEEVECQPSEPSEK